MNSDSDNNENDKITEPVDVVSPQVNPPYTERVAPPPSINASPVAPPNGLPSMVGFTSPNVQNVGVPNNQVQQNQSKPVNNFNAILNGSAFKV